MKYHRTLGSTYGWQLQSLRFVVKLRVSYFVDFRPFSSLEVQWGNIVQAILEIVNSTENYHMMLKDACNVVSPSRREISKNWSCWLFLSYIFIYSDSFPCASFKVKGANVLYASTYRLILRANAFFRVMVLAPIDHQFVVSSVIPQDNGVVHSVLSNSNIKLLVIRQFVKHVPTRIIRLYTWKNVLTAPTVKENLVWIASMVVGPLIKLSRLAPVPSSVDQRRGSLLLVATILSNSKLIDVISTLLCLFQWVKFLKGSLLIMIWVQKRM